MEEIYARIEDYLDDLLTPTDRADFEAQLSAHPELAADLEQVREARARLARQLAEQNDDAALTTTLQAIGQQHFSSTATPSPSLRAAQPPSSRRWWLAAAAVIAAAFITWLMWPKADTPARLYAEHRRFPEANFTFKGSENAAQSLQTTANFFNQKNYTAALGGFQQYFSTGADNLEARFFTGLCQLELGKTAEAESTFSTLRDGSSAWAGEAAWYLALTHLRSQNLEACAAMLRQIKPGEPHADEASRLLLQMERR